MGPSVANRARSYQAFSLRGSLFTLALAAAPLACSDGTPPGNVAANTGSIGLSLTANGVTIRSVGYVITGPGSYATSGTLDVSRSSTLGGLIGAIPAGSGYTITLSATPTSGAASCSGAAPFSVVAGQTTPVSVELLCHESPTTGSVLVKGTVNLCAQLNDVSASPAARGRRWDGRAVGSSVRCGQWASRDLVSVDGDGRHAFGGEFAERNARLHGVEHRHGDDHRLGRRPPVLGNGHRGRDVRRRR